MVKTKPVKSIRHRWTNRNWDFGAVIVALLGTFLLIVSFLSRPHFEILDHTVVLTQGVVAPAIVMGSIVWAMIEYFTPPGTTLVDLLVRIIPAFVIGGFVGGFIGFEYHFGQYVLQPAFNGNYDALLFLIASMLAGIAVTWNAAWEHKHGFRGQKGKGIRNVTKNESGTSKGARGMLMLLVIFLVVLLMAPIGTAVGQAFVTGHDDSHILQDESSVAYISGSGSPVPFASANGTATFDFPSTTSHNVTTYSHTVYVESHLTLAELNNFAASKIVLASNVKAFNVTMGTGTNSTNFSPISSVTSGNSTSASLPISPALLTGNQSAPVTFKIQANSSAMSLSISTYGNNGLVTVFGPYPALQVAYIIGAIILFAASFMELSMYDINLNVRKYIAPRTRRSGGGK